MRFGAQVHDAGVHFRLWCPKHDRVSLKLEAEDAPRPMQALGDGWHELRTDAARPGSLYRFELPDGLAIPDPASRYQPFDVHGPSEVIDPAAYAWKDAEWRGRPWEETVVYELHVGAFTAEGTFQAAAERLDTLAELGVTAVELMPLADFPGKRNWGYDGVQLFAPDASYGRPEDLKALVDAAHRRGLMVLLDVVYNHFGPEGNYWPACGPIFTDLHETAWGAAVNFDAEGSPTVRELVIANALYWLSEFCFDGLRLDAVHAIKDDSPMHILEEIAESVRGTINDREVHLILENEENTVTLLERGDDRRPKQYTAQWNDDLHHVLHTAATGEDSGYYADYLGDMEKLGRTLAEGFAFQGELMPYRKKHRGAPSAGLPPTAFVAFIQNHDQIGNRAFGDRLTATAPPEAVRAVAAASMLSPQIPMLFMGEEWGTSKPFPFFCDFGPDLAEAVRRGRRAEFARFPEFRDPKTRDLIPDPTAEQTFLSAKLDGSDHHVEWRAFYRAVLDVRRREIVPRLRTVGGGCGRYEVLGRQAVRVRWTLGDGSALTLLANLSAEPCAADPPAGRLLWREGSQAGGQLAPWTVIYSIDEEGSDGG